MTEYTIRYNGKEQRFPNWMDAEAWLQHMSEAVEDEGYEVLQYHDMIAEVRENRFVDFKNKDFGEGGSYESHISRY